MKKRNPSVTERVDDSFRYIRAIDNHIRMGMLSIDINRAVVIVDSYLQIYYSRPYKGDEDRMYKGFCQMLRLWINYQRSVKRGHLIQLVEDGDFDGISRTELSLRSRLVHPLLRSLPSPTLSEIPLPSSDDIEEKRAYHLRYISEKYRLLTEEDILQVVAVNSHGKPYVLIFESGIPSRLVRRTPSEAQTINL